MSSSTEYASIVQAQARKCPERVALEFRNETWTYGRLETSIVEATNALRRLGVKPGDRVALLLESTPTYVVCQFAIARLGATFVTPNPSWTVHETRHALEAANVRVSIVDADHGRHSLDGSSIIQTADIVRSNESEPAEDGDSRLGPTSELFIPFSSGTTGFPKGVIHTVGSVDGAIDQLIRHTELGPDDHLQVSIPLCHIFGTTMLSAALKVGARVTLFERFDFDECIGQLRTGNVTVWPLAGSVAHRLSRRGDLSVDDFPALRFFMWGGSPVPAELARRITDATGVGFLCSYGMTEAMMVTFNPVDDPSRWSLDSPGFATEGTELRLGDDNELEVRGPSVATGYTLATDDVAAPAESPFSEDGWFRTGDIARIDSTGRVWIVDRKKDMIKVSGFQVAPVEVETELLRHPAVLDAAVVAESDERTGQRVVGYIVTSEQIDMDRLRDAASERLASYKVPSEIRIVDAIPRTNTGKLQRARLTAVPIENP
ncbi:MULTISPECIES: class I adenylate-forming enzyme family protein [Rhodococcus]|uniref:Class I adenylate-forming enzyme family protein n=1 Tax=Rhodococcus oxybenzonivorans TaxID=1990687 RepID=A0AAE5A6M4_9NOCA|nr:MULTISPECIES: class I adenylate-forming enzyme family protein [Rhodococcus]MDV7240558.1 class I adenylate-forming enzyme family protein [Rhodococcus oxybenzonivorans]MDV7265747.1 class I adenylate-forming enzyme family protein [Rhodococcus oxybenzonivorans]MDV7272831.1 class I adenylate-forming enzyme family protein [Rhodococcus oxybenzonivorans]MDV7333430.1 class I adenylate-forming enzyme family protein [Rhodococcus oxybenzonivorans]MDV7342597.1 class I adenylate-forming enzyme family pro